MKFSEAFIKKSKISDYNYEDTVHPTDVPGQSYFPDMEDQQQINNEKNVGLNQVPKVREELVQLEHQFWKEFNKVNVNIGSWEKWEAPGMSEDEKNQYIDAYKNDFDMSDYLRSLDQYEMAALKLKYLQELADSNYKILIDTKYGAGEQDFPNLLFKILADPIEENQNIKDRFFDDFTHFLTGESLSELQKKMLDYSENIEELTNNLKKDKESTYIYCRLFFKDPSVAMEVERDEDFIKSAFDELDENFAGVLQFDGRLLEDWKKWCAGGGVDDEEVDNYIYHKYQYAIDDAFSEREYTNIDEDKREHGIENLLEHLSSTNDVENEIEINEILALDHFFSDSHTGSWYKIYEVWEKNLHPIAEKMQELIDTLPDEAKQALNDQLPESNKDTRKFDKAKKVLDKRMDRDCPDKEVEYSMAHDTYPDDIEEASNALNMDYTMRFDNYMGIINDGPKSEELAKRIKYYRERDEGHGMNLAFEDQRKMYERELGRRVDNKEMKVYINDRDNAWFKTVKNIHKMLGHPIPFEDAVRLIENPEEHEALKQRYFNETATREEKERQQRKQREQEEQRNYQQHEQDVNKLNVQPLEGNNQAVMLNIINKLRQRGNVSKQELEQFFNKYKVMNAQS